MGQRSSGIGKISSSSPSARRPPRPARWRGRVPSSSVPSAISWSLYPVRLVLAVWPGRYSRVMGHVSPASWDRLIENRCEPRVQFRGVYTRLFQTRRPAVMPGVICLLKKRRHCPPTGPPLDPPADPWLCRGTAYGTQDHPRETARAVSLLTHENPSGYPGSCGVSANQLDPADVPKGWARIPWRPGIIAVCSGARIADNRTMRVTVFGSTGGLGRELIGQAAAAGHLVVAVARAPEALDELAARYDGLTVIRGDVLDPASLAMPVATRTPCCPPWGSATVGTPRPSTHAARRTS